MGIAALTLILTAAPAWAQPNTRLTPEEAREGWVLLFDGATIFGWDTDGDARVDQGRLDLGPGKASISLRVPLPSAEVAIESRGTLQVRCTSGTWRSEHVTRGGPNGAGPEKDWSSVRLLHEAADNGRKVQLQVGTASSTDVTRLTPDLPLGPTHLTIESSSGAELRAVKMRLLNARPLFNGIDLKGWQIFPGKKSEFNVRDGAIQVKNGPGDLQTTGKFQDFILQLECKSNGKHLNSGVFFRCRENEYQNGYEAQVQNDFSADPPKEYAVEVYDAKTHQMVEKKKVKSAAVDFGTGAIYRRIPARSGVAKDGEWFTMTVAAHGNHFATWVNGVPQVDWHDHRPPSDNARTGFRRLGGHLSLQGHDPTTDLSFRNFRIAELPSGD